MNQWKFCILKPGVKEVITNPSWDQIHSILDQLDGYNLDHVSLLCDQVGDLMVAGGDEYNGGRLYYVSYYNDGYSEELVNSSVSEMKEEYINITVQKVGTDILKRYLAEYKDMIKAVKHFFETGELTEDQKWE
jgi:hypothetical protein